MVRLEKFSDKHLPATYNWMQDEDLRRNFLFRRKLSPADHQQWFVNFSYLL
jgi:hypothetical protein